MSALRRDGTGCLAQSVSSVADTDERGRVVDPGRQSTTLQLLALLASCCRIALRNRPDEVPTRGFTVPPRLYDSIKCAQLATIYSGPDNPT